jgi:hypothetical protein
MNALRAGLLSLAVPLTAWALAACGGIVAPEETGGVVIDPSDGGHPLPVLDSGPIGVGDDDGSTPPDQDAGPPDANVPPPTPPMPVQPFSSTTTQVTFAQQVVGPLPMAAPGSSCTPDFETYIFTLPATLSYQRCEPATDGSNVYSMQSGSLVLSPDERNILLAACEAITLRSAADPAACGASGQSVYTATFLGADGSEPIYWDCPRGDSVEADNIDQAVSTAEELTKSS